MSAVLLTAPINSAPSSSVKLMTALFCPHEQPVAVGASLIEHDARTVLLQVPVLRQGASDPPPCPAMRIARPVPLSSGTKTARSRERAAAPALDTRARGVSTGGPARLP